MVQPTELAEIIAQRDNVQALLRGILAVLQAGDERAINALLSSINENPNSTAIDLRRLALQVRQASRDDPAIQRAAASLGWLLSDM